MDRIGWIENYAELSAEAASSALLDNAQTLSDIVDSICESLTAGAKVIFFGNGGSAADAQHLAAELVNRYLMDRDELAGLALTTDTSVLTSISNDFGYDHIFEKQIRALARKGDVAIGISTSGTSKNVVLGLEAARKIGCVTVGLTGAEGRDMTTLCDFLLLVDAPSTPLVQQGHIALGHALCDLVEQQLFGED